MVKKVVVAVIAAVLVLGGFGIQQATAKESLPEGSLMRKVDVRNCAERVANQSTEYLTKGASGHCVWILQVALKRQGYDVSTDGSFGPKTANMVLGFNRAYGLNQNSKGEPQATADCETFMKLAEKLKPYPGVQTRAPYKAAWDADTIG
jgi:peptidoglycan hydrolase-like protein with peptidoglycan-binding domain